MFSHSCVIVWDYLGTNVVRGCMPRNLEVMAILLNDPNSSPLIHLIVHTNINKAHTLLASHSFVALN